MSDKEFIDAIKENPIIKFNDDNSIEIPDTKTYIQASGRVSRLYAGRVTKGLFIVIVDDQSLLKVLEFQLRWYFDNTKFMRPD
jgi:reverse gyrase